MKNKIIRSATLLFALVCFTTLKAQQNRLKVNYKINQDRSVDFNFEKADPGTYTVILTFKELSNSTSSNVQQAEIDGYSGKILTLKPQDPNKSVGFSYTYTSLRGKLRPKYNPDFTYLLPYKPGTNVKVAEAGFVGAKYFGNTTPEDWKVYRFYTKTEDSVLAVRKGVVVELTDLYETEDIASVEYSSKVNQIYIEHPDGTLARYGGFKKGSFAVKVGQTVYPGTVLGVNSKQRKNSNNNISLALLYLKSDDVESRKDATLGNSKSLYGHITPHFYTESEANVLLTAGKEYLSANTLEIIRKEFSKKELKKLSK